ncbi:MAG: hypothetical protein AAF585_02060, partial [Verrucomicrobiota bacterium]
MSGSAGAPGDLGESTSGDFYDDEARALTDELADLAARQSAPITGHAIDKDREETDLENEAHQLGRGLVGFAQDQENEALAAKYDLPISSWRAMRDEALLQRARLLESDAGDLVAGPDSAAAEEYGVTATAVADLKEAADDFEALIVAPQDAIADRSALTAALRPKSRETRAKFDELEDFLPQFKGTPTGDEFVAAFLASTQIIDRGHGPSDEPEASSSTASSSSSASSDSSSSSSS